MTVNIKGLGKITASKKVLNELVIAFANSATYYMKSGKYTLSEKEDNRSNAIWEQLTEVGYYNK